MGVEERDIVAAWEEGTLALRSLILSSLPTDSAQSVALHFDHIAQSLQWSASDAPGRERATLGARPSPEDFFTSLTSMSEHDVLLYGAAGLWLRAAAAEAWEASWEVDQILASIQAFKLCLPSQAPFDDARLTLISRFLGFLEYEFLVEDVASVSSLGAWAAAAAAAAVSAGELAEAAATVGGMVGRLVWQAMSQETAYYECVGDAVAHAKRLLTCEGQELSDAIDETAEQAARIDRLASGMDIEDSSELASHAASLRALASNVSRAEMVVDSGALTILYPFGLPDLPCADVLQLLDETHESWPPDALRPEVYLSDLPVSDVWRGLDSESRQYGGRAFVFPDLDFRDNNGGRRSINVSMWLTTIGNNCVRLKIQLGGEGPQELFDLQKLSAPELGDVRRAGSRLAVPGTDLDWRSPVELAQHLIAALQTLLSTASSEPVSAVFSPASFRVVSVVTQMSARDRLRGSRAAVKSTETLPYLVGGLTLMNPVGPSMTSVSQWAQFTAPGGTRIAVPGAGDVLAYATANTVLLFAPGLPWYAANSYADVMEFTEGLQALLDAWMSRLHRHGRELTRVLTEARSALESGRLTSALARQQQEVVQREQLAIREFVATCRLTLLFIDSASLVTSPTVRDFLDRLLTARAFRQRSENSLEVVQRFALGQVDIVLGALGERLATAEHAAAAHREERQRRAIDALLGGMTVVGLAGLAQIIQSGFEIHDLATLWLVGTVCLLALLAFIYIWRTGSNHDD